MIVMGRECRYLSLKLVQSQVPHACLRYKITFESALSLGFLTCNRKVETPLSGSERAKL